MLTTIIIDAYKENQKGEIADALNDICSPNDSYGFSSAGVYSFWNPENGEILYIGLAGDFADRFAQHNGLKACKPQHCKIEKITNFFKGHEYLGYSIAVQAALAQPMNWRNLLQFGDQKDEVKTDFADWSQENTNPIKHLEGLLIETHRLVYGRLPAWNDTPASVAGQRMASNDADAVLKCLAWRHDGPILARTSLRGLSSDSTAMTLEELLHAARIQMVFTGTTLDEAILRIAVTNPMAAERIDEIMDYLKRTPDLPTRVPPLSGAVPPANTLQT